MKSDTPHVFILLATHNGEANLRDQLDSLAAQDFKNWALLVSDDHSSDGTLEILENFASEGHKVDVHQGPSQGAGANFMSLLRRLKSDKLNGSYLAFCDQDDVWLPDRLSRGMKHLEQAAVNEPALYCSRTWVTDEHLNIRHKSAPRPRPLSFRNALVQNVASGNTILLNPKAAAIVCDAGQEAGHVPFHDWWVYQIVSGIGGVLVHDNEPTLLYRQHGINELGANTNAKAKLRRARYLMSGTYTDWNKQNVAALGASVHRFKDANKLVLERFAKLHNASFLGRVVLVVQTNVYRQTASSTLALWFAAVFNRI